MKRKLALYFSLIFLFLLGNSAIVVGQTTNDDLPIHQNKKHIETCTQNLLAIGKAIKKYHEEHNKYPKWLSDLHPVYITNSDLLICPADVDAGNPLIRGNPQYNPNPEIDGKIPGSYDYQFHPLQRIERTIEAQRAFYGDVVPIACCWHHSTHEFRCINLDFSSNVYKSTMWWHRAPEMAYGGIEPAIAALESGFKKFPNQEYYFDVYPRLYDLYIKAKKTKEAENLINRFKVVLNPISIRQSKILGDLLESNGQTEELANLFKNLLKHHKENRSIYRHLSRIYEKLGDDELALEYKEKAEPVSALVGESVPDFSAKDLEGEPISLEAYRGKVVLVDFWAVWCGPCIAEMPNLKNVYNAYKDKGFDIIGISLDNNEKTLHDFITENEIPWRQVFDGQGWDSTIPQQFGIRAIPSMWLIDREGKMITNQARGEKLEKMVKDALKEDRKE